MTEKTAPWWRSFVGKRRKAARESASILEQDLAGQTVPESQQQPMSVSIPDQRGVSVISSQEAREQAVLGEDTYDDSVVQPTFNESANLRNLRVSRSGRFKEKRRTRVGLPDEYEKKERAEPLRKGDKK